LVFGEALRRLRLLLCWKLVFGEALRRLRLLLCVGTYILRRECMACAWIFLLDMELSTVSRLLGFGVQNTGESPVLRGVFRHDKGYLGPGVHGVHLDLHARREALDGGSATLSDRSFPRGVSCTAATCFCAFTWLAFGPTLNKRSVACVAQPFAISVWQKPTFGHTHVCVAGVSAAAGSLWIPCKRRTFFDLLSMW